MRYLVGSVGAFLLFVGAHFGMGALNPVPAGQSSWLVPLTRGSTSWMPGLGNPGFLSTLLGILAVAGFGVALLGLFGWWVRQSWMRPALLVGVCSLVVAYVLYFTPWGLLPLVPSVLALYVLAARRWSPFSLRRAQPKLRPRSAGQTSAGLE